MFFYINPTTLIQLLIFSLLFFIVFVFLYSTLRFLAPERPFRILRLNICYLIRLVDPRRTDANGQAGQPARARHQPHRQSDRGRHLPVPASTWPPPAWTDGVRETEVGRAVLPKRHTVYEEHKVGTVLGTVPGTVIPFNVHILICKMYCALKGR